MSRRVPFLTWLLFYVWYAWGAALQSFLADPSRLGAWTPEVGVVLLVAVEGVLPRREATGAAIGIALLRTAFSADPPFAVVAGLLTIAWSLAGLRSLLIVDRALARTALAFFASFGFAIWLAFAHARTGGATFDLALGSFLSTAVATALATLVGVPLARRLPGLTPLWQRRYA
ncbi:MAG: hypothetical protein WD226_03190 [Planctomycetota bacterium]